MNILYKSTLGVLKILSPLFAIVAKSGICMPHRVDSDSFNSELILFRKGVKPTILINQYNVTTELEELVERGGVVHIDTNNEIIVNRIYCNPNEVEAAEAAAIIFQKRCNKEEVSEDDALFVYNFIGAPLDGKERTLITDQEYYDVQDALNNGKTHRLLTPLFEGKVKSFTAIPVLDGYKHEKMMEYVEDGIISFVEFERNLQNFVYSQKNKVEDGKELFARYYKNGEGYEALDNKESIKRIGHLLGYTKNDVELFVGDKYQNPVIRGLMDKTQDARRACRVLSMMFKA